MYKNKKTVSILFTLPVAAAALPSFAEGFLEDSKASLQLQNYYLNRDYREGVEQNKREEWAQGFILDLRSGYTLGTIGVGVDALGMLGLKLDSSPDRSGTGLLPVHDDGRAADEFSRLGLTFKVRMGQSEAHYGTLIPKLPTVQANTGRILPQTFEGGIADIRPLDNLSVTLARLDRMTDRDSTERTDLTLNNRNSRFSGTVEGDDFRIGGTEARLSKTLKLTYQYAELRDVYDQHFAGLNHSVKVGPGQLKTDIRLSHSGEAGASRGGDIDSSTLGGLMTYALGGHALGIGWQRMYGDTSMPYLNGTDPYLVNYIQLNDFAEPGERSWQLRYDYDFAEIGLPGLAFMVRHVKGDHADAATVSDEGHEWERNVDLQYTVQSGPLKALNLRWRNAVYRSSFARDMEENRLIVSYTIPLR